MRRFLPFLSFVLFSISISAQTIVTDRVEQDGRRQVMTKGIDLDFGMYQYTFTLKAYSGELGTTWVLLVSSVAPIPDNAGLLIKLEDDRVLEFPINSLQMGNKSNPLGYMFQYGNVAVVTPPGKQDLYIAVFEVQPEQLAEMINNGVKKIRISSSASHDYREKSLGANRLARYLESSRKAIRNQLKKPNSLDQLREGF